MLCRKHDKGGHFAAWEQTELFTEDVCAGFRPLRDKIRSWQGRRPQTRWPRTG